MTLDLAPNKIKSDLKNLNDDIQVIHSVKSDDQSNSQKSKSKITVISKGKTIRDLQVDNVETQASRRNAPANHRTYT